MSATSKRGLITPAEVYGVGSKSSGLLPEQIVLVASLA
jgi:hypothetical protein